MRITSAGASVNGKLQKETNQAKLSFLFPHAHNQSQENQPSDCGHYDFDKRCTSSFQPSNQFTTRWHKRKDGTPSFQKHAILKLVTKISKEPDKQTGRHHNVSFSDFRKFRARSSSSVLVSFFVAHSQIKVSPRLSTLLPMSCPPKCDVPIFPSPVNHFGPTHVPSIFKCLLLFQHLIHQYLFAVTHHSVRCFASSLFLATKIHFSFGFGLRSSQSFHSSTKQ